MNADSFPIASIIKSSQHRLNQIYRQTFLIKKIFYQVQKKKRVALASFPRSGNTWVRSLIEDATGQLTGSVYKDQVMSRGREGIVIKTHELDSYLYTHAIHLLRNPFDSIESYYFWKRDIGGFNDSWEEHVRTATIKWYSHTLHWNQAKCQVFRLHFEDLRKDTFHSLQSMLIWLGFKLSNEQLQRVIDSSNLRSLRKKNPNVGVKFFRHGFIGEGIGSFNNEQIEFVIEQLGTLLIDVGYGDLFINQINTI